MRKKCYRILRGLSIEKDGIGKGLRLLPGELVDGFPKGVDVKHLIAKGAVEEVDLDSSDDLATINTVGPANTLEQPEEPSEPQANTEPATPVTEEPGDDEASG